MDDYLNKTRAVNPILQVLSLLFVVFGFMILGDTIVLGLVSLIFDYKITGVNSLFLLFGNGDRLQNALLVIQAAKASLAFIILPLLYIFLFKKHLKAIFQLNTELIPHFLLAGLILFFISMPLLGFVVEWNKNIQLPSAWKGLELWMQESEKQNGELTNLLIFFDSKAEMVTILIVVAILPAIGEELLFRGLLQNEMVRILRNPHVAILLAAILFSALHFQFYGFFPRLGLGILFGYMYYWSGNIL
ncbi:MAG TPA: CPBP family intramembrane glutamic endopeptidase, partial [Cytophagaceae bacterium]